MLNLILNQYRERSGYKDIVGETYHFPNRYLGSFQDLPCSFVYYEPREGGDQVYFGLGVVAAVNDDSEESGHSYADVVEYISFQIPLSFYDGPDGATWEPATTMRNSVRRIDTELFSRILEAAQIDTFPCDRAIHASPRTYETRLQQQLDSLQAKSRKSPVVLRKVKRIVEAYERPSFVTNAVKRIRGDTCQLCGCRGFVKRDGTRYCEVHHLFHLADNPPRDCLAPEFLVVLCANCHRRMHYADVGLPERTQEGWSVVIDGEAVCFESANNELPTQSL